MAFQLKPVPHNLVIPQAILDAKEKGNLAVLRARITQKTFLFYKIEDIQNIVIKLYEKQETNIANEICNKFWNNKQFFLKDIYDKYNK